MQGYNIALKVDGKTILGRTQDDLTISARTKESITKDDAGVVNTAVTGHDITFKATALIDLSTPESTEMNRDDVIAMALKTGDDAIIDIAYECEGGDAYEGEAIITGYSESSSADADADATLTVDLKVVGDLTLVTSGS